DVDGHERDLLADVVVQLTRDARPFGLLGPEQPPAQIADSIVACAQLCLTSTRQRLGLAALHRLNEQGPDQGGLCQQDRQRADDVGFVALPDAGLAKPDERAGWNARLGDTPALQLPPIDLPGM